MARGEKPYRVYRGGRVRGPVPLERKRREQEKPGRPEADGRARYKSPGRRRRRRWTWKRGVLVGVLTFFVLALAWGVTSYLAFRSGVAEANDRLDRRTRRALVPQDGLLLSRPTHVLVLGTDGGRSDRRGSRRADSMMVIRTDPDRHRLYYLSILRDLRVEVPGFGTQKINAASQFGGPALAVRTVRAVTGLPINHVIVVDFADFKDLIDALGGVTVNVPRPILSNKFDCPYRTQAQCDRWPGWRFSKGERKLDGRRALVYSRIRTNRLNPADSDASRAGRQQQVVQAVTDKLTSPWTVLKMPFIGGDVAKPLATDMSAWQLLQLGWVKFRAGTTFHCRLGGSPSGGFIIPDEEAVNTLLMVRGRAAPQPPPPGNLFGSGCSRRLVLGA